VDAPGPTRDALPGAAPPDPGDGASDPRLVALIRDEILASPGRRITFARFMERALTEPGLGYYAASGTRPTREGDFLTAPELHPFFGRCIGRQLTGIWERLGSPERFTVREHGAGRRTLERTVADGLAADTSPLGDAIEWQAVDVPGRHPEPPRSGVVGVILANELLDALPVHRLGVREGRVLERYVTWRGDGFADDWAEPSTPELVIQLEAEGVALTVGQSAEVSLAVPAWVAGAATSLARGALLVFDYGHPAHELYGAPRFGGTLATYRGHRAGDDPYVALGRQDITAHVDLTAVERAALGSGLVALGATTQAQFLAALGLGEMLWELGRQPDTSAEAYLLARAAVARFLDPRHLGGFRVLAFGRGVAVEPPLQGFSLAGGPDARGR
jgi:SAM-dependent MidA family methyltransferase